MASMNMIQALNSAMSVTMERDPKVVVFGEDVGYFGGVFRCTQGLQQKFGSNRVFDTPISESGIVGAAAAAGYGPLHVGTDIGGSIRLPAAANGVVGLKPTYGRVSRYALLPRVWSLDTVGPLTRTVRDCARLTAVIAGADANDPTASTQPVPRYEKLPDGRIRGLKIGVPRNHYLEGITADVERAMDDSLAVLRRCGARIVEVDVPDPQHTYQLTNAIGQVESATIYANWLRERPQDFLLVVRTRSEAGLLVPAVSYLEALNARSRITAEFVQKVFGVVDALHAPVMTMPLPTRNRKYIRTGHSSRLGSSRTGPAAL